MTYAGYGTSLYLLSYFCVKESSVFCELLVIYHAEVSFSRFNNLYHFFKIKKSRCLCHQVKKAFFALMQNGVKAAALWDSRRQDLIGL